MLVRQPQGRKDERVALVTSLPHEERDAQEWLLATVSHGGSKTASTHGWTYRKTTTDFQAAMGEDNLAKAIWLVTASRPTL